EPDRPRRSAPPEIVHVPARGAHAVATVRDVRLDPDGRHRRPRGGRSRCHAGSDPALAEALSGVAEERGANQGAVSGQNRRSTPGGAAHPARQGWQGRPEVAGGPRRLAIGCSAFTSTFRSAPPSATTATSIEVCSTRG